MVGVVPVLAVFAEAEPVDAASVATRALATTRVVNVALASIVRVDRFPTVLAIDHLPTFLA